MNLKENQSAIILEASEDGEITVDISSPDMDSFSTKFVCVAIEKKITGDVGIPGSVEGDD